MNVLCKEGSLISIAHIDLAEDKNRYIYMIITFNVKNRSTIKNVKHLYLRKNIQK